MTVHSRKCCRSVLATKLAPIPLRGAQRSETDILCIVRTSGPVQAPDCGAPASRSDFAAGLIPDSVPGSMDPLNLHLALRAHPDCDDAATVIGKMRSLVLDELIDEKRRVAGNEQH